MTQNTDSKNYEINFDEILEQQKFERNFLDLSRIKSFFIDLKEGLKNFWYFRKEIYRFRWYDYGYFMDLQKRAFQKMYQNWDKCHYINSEAEKEKLKRIIELHNELEELEESLDYDIQKIHEQKIQKYRELSNLLYEPDENGIIQIEKYWD